MSSLLQRVRRVRYQLAQKHFFFLVQTVRHDVQQTSGFRLELVLFRRERRRCRRERLPRADGGGGSFDVLAKAALESLFPNLGGRDRRPRRRHPSLATTQKRHRSVSRRFGDRRHRALRGEVFADGKIRIAIGSRRRRRRRRRKGCASSRFPRRHHHPSSSSSSSFVLVPSSTQHKRRRFSSSSSAGKEERPSSSSRASS